MSAAEKLKTLLHKAETAERGWDNDIHGEPLLTALPQILAVVQAAERVCDEEPLYKQAGLDLEAALSALDAALS